MLFSRRNSLCGFAPKHLVKMAGLIKTRKTLPVSEVVTRGARLSPFEDFKVRTLSALSGPWARLFYMAELRSADGTYCHWGHSRVHGETRSQAALAKIHSELFTELLRTPIRELMEAAAGEGDPADFRDRLSNIDARAVPEGLDGGSRRHFNSIVLAARLLSADRQASNRSSA